VNGKTQLIPAAKEAERADFTRSLVCAMVSEVSKMRGPGQKVLRGYVL